MHIDPTRLYKISQLESSEYLFQTTETEKKHLKECEECQRLLAIFAREFDAKNPPHDAA